jgi:hypothetical protein
MAGPTRTTSDASSWPGLILQAAVWGVCSGATLFLLQQNYNASSATKYNLYSSTAIEKKQARSILDCISMACALLQPRVFLGMMLWKTYYWQTRDDESSPSNSKGSSSAVRPAAAAGKESPDARKESMQRQKKRHLELLVHNVSHTDLILGLETAAIPPRASSTSQPVNTSTTDNYNESYILCRPRFSRFLKYTFSIYQQLTPSSLLSLACYQRRYDTPQYSIVLSKSQDNDPSSSDYHQHPPTPTGLYLDRPVPLDNNAEVRVRGRDIEKLQARMQIRQVFFPLLASLLPRWKQQIALQHNLSSETSATKPPSSSSSSNNIYRVLVLISGVGTPRDTTQDPQGNSTRVCAQLMQHFLHMVDPDIAVIHIHSDWNIFRYDENVRFVKEIFLPRIHAYRDAHARGEPYPHEDQHHRLMQQATRFRESWRNSFRTTISWADGSNARTYAIQCTYPLCR